MKRHPYLIGMFITLIFLVIHLFLMNDYGLTWDFHHIFFAGLKFIGRPVTAELTDHIPFGKPSPWDMFDVPFGQIMPMLAALGYHVFYENLRLLPLDSAFHLSTVILGSIGIFFLYQLLSQTINTPVAILASLFLALYPRYFSDTQNNIKDVPQAVFFALSMLLLWRLINRRKPHDLIMAALAFGLAFNTKINALFIPAIALSWIIVLLVTRAYRNLEQPIKFRFTPEPRESAMPLPPREYSISSTPTA